MPRPRRGFTLVELLVVIAIIGILMALLFPAINAIREAARQVECKNHLSQIGKGCLQHRATQGFFPTGGWGWRWVGDPDRGFTLNQPSGWMFNLLPYIGEAELHDLGKGQPDAQKRALGKERVGRVIPLYLCASRRNPSTYVFHGDYYNIDRPEVTARNDYASNSGDLGGGSAGPPTLAAGDNMSDDEWSKLATGSPDSNRAGRNLTPNGVMYMRSMVKAIPDGDTCTYLAGEKHLNTTALDTDSLDNNEGWDMGYDWDVVRWTNIAPHQDDPVDRGGTFGGPHGNGFVMVFCDGHVEVMSYDVDPEIHRQLGNRMDGYPTDVTKGQ